MGSEGGEDCGTGVVIFLSLGSFSSSFSENSTSPSADSSSSTESSSSSDSSLVEDAETAGLACSDFPGAV